MATTYGYGGEFSSDEDIDKLEQQQNERMAQTKFDNNLRPSKKQIEDTIDTIKRMPFDQEVSLSDEMLAGLLDHFKTQRGPIVDSTRKLYNKIALRLIRGDYQSQLLGDDYGAVKDTNGSSNNNNNNINTNNNSIKFMPKAPQQKADTFSSDEDDDLPVFNRRNVAHNDNDENKMDVDSETPTGPIRETKQVDMSTTDEEDEDDGDESETSDEDTSELEELNSESDVMDVTPIKPPADQQGSSADKEREGVEALIAVSRVASRQTDFVKPQPLAQSTPKDPAETGKKPYTRSQRIATRSATRGKVSNDQSAKSLTNATANTDISIQNRRAPSKRFVLLYVALLVAVLAFLLYYFRSNLTSSALPFLGPRVKF